MSRIIDYTDRATCILLATAGPAGGASDDDSAGSSTSSTRSTGGRAYLNMPPGRRLPASLETVQNGCTMSPGWQQVFKYAVRKMYDLCRNLLDRTESVRRFGA